ncbi:MAG: GNAT family N-acetyltransferase [Planctomycetota bacterium]
MSKASVTIRPATLDDCPRINEIYNHAILHTTASFHMQSVNLEYRENWIQQHGPRHPVIVAESAGKVVGWGCLSQWSERQAYDATCENSVFVDSEFQGQRLSPASPQETHQAIGFTNALASS